jgi:radical SAM-linked protein
VNYHDKAVSQIEAVLTRGDTSLCSYIEALYKKGCYLDAWGEHFSMRVWHEAAEECGINLAELAEHQYPLDEPLPWDFIDVGIDKEWFVKEFKACETAPTCETGCVNCGVCKNLKTKKILAKPHVIPNLFRDLAASTDGKTLNRVQGDTRRYRLKLTKTGILRYFSHLDWQGTFFKAVARSGLNVAFSQGFNPGMKISMGIALPLFAQSKCELVDIELYDDISPDALKLKLQKNLPPESEIISIVKIEKSAPAIDHTASWAEYEIKIFNRGLYDFETLVYNTNKVLSSEEIFIEKKTKKDLIKTIDIKKSIKSHRFEGQSLFIVLKTGQSATHVDISTNVASESPVAAIPAVRADILMDVIAPGVMFDITRTRFFDKDDNVILRTQSEESQ